MALGAMAAEMAGESIEPGMAQGPAGLGLAFAEVLGPQERRLAASIVERLVPADPQEEMLSWKLAVTHLLAAERIGKSRQPDLPDRPQQIELGLAVRLMSLNQRESAALDRHREKKRKAEQEERREVEKAAAKTAKRGETEAARDAESGGGFLVVPEKVSPQEWSRRVRPQQRRLMSGEPEPEGHPEARRRLWEERCAYAVKEAVERGVTGRTLTAPYPTDEEVAARAEAERTARASRETPEGPAAEPEGPGVPPEGPPGREREGDP